MAAKSRKAPLGGPFFDPAQKGFVWVAQAGAAAGVPHGAPFRFQGIDIPARHQIACGVQGGNA